MEPRDAQDIVMAMVRDERGRQDVQWGSQRHLPPGIWLAILTEEVGEAAQAVLEALPPEFTVMERDDVLQLLRELIQTAAVAVAWGEAIVLSTVLSPGEITVA